MKRKDKNRRSSDFVKQTMPPYFRIISFDLHKRAHEIFEKDLERQRISYLASVADCESPIEQIFRAAIEVMIESDIFLPYQLRPYFAEINVINQQQVGAYRVDFMVEVYHHPPNGISGIPVRIVVECDGHEFHEKTREQAAKDKARDRYLQMCGYKVLRFTGSEIWKDPEKCAKETIDIVLAELKREMPEVKD